MSFVTSQEYAGLNTQYASREPVFSRYDEAIIAAVYATSLMTLSQPRIDAASHAGCATPRAAEGQLLREEPRLFRARCQP